MRRKHRNDYNHGKDGWVGGNPRYGKSRGFRKGQRAATKQQERKEMPESETFTQALERCRQELADTGEATFMGETIRPKYDQLYTITGHDEYNTVRGAMFAIKKGKTDA